MDSDKKVTDNQNTLKELEDAYEIELARIEESIGQKLTQEFYDNKLEALNVDDYYTITLLRQAVDTALEELCDVEVDDNQKGYALFIGGKYYGIFDTMILAQEYTSELLENPDNKFKVPIFPSIIPLMTYNDN
jgi:hypothetical protein